MSQPPFQKQTVLEGLLKRRNDLAHERSSPTLKRNASLQYMYDSIHPKESENHINKLETDVLKKELRSIEDRKILKVLADEPHNKHTMPIPPTLTERIIAERKRSQSLPGTKPSITKALFSNSFPVQPFFSLETDDLSEDVDTNLLSWSINNVLAIGLDYQVHLFDIEKEKIHCFLNLNHNRKVTSLCWSEDGIKLSVGISTGEIYIYDVITNQEIYGYREHPLRVCALSWNGSLLASGSDDKKILLKDPRQNTVTASFEGQSSEICSLKWCPAHLYLASGSLSEDVLIWDKRSMKLTNRLSGHKVAAKAISWNPAKGGVIATGTRCQDGLVRTWNTHSDCIIHSKYTNSQITGIEWSPEGTDLITCHSGCSNEMIVWRYPSFHQLAILDAHQSDICFMTASTDRTSIVTGSGQDAVCLWKLYPKTGVSGVSRRTSLLR